MASWHLGEVVRVPQKLCLARLLRVWERTGRYSANNFRTIIVSTILLSSISLPLTRFRQIDKVRIYFHDLRNNLTPWDTGRYYLRRPSSAAPAPTMADDKPKFNFAAPTSTDSSIVPSTLASTQPPTGGLFSSTGTGTGSLFGSSGFGNFGVSKSATDTSNPSAVGATTSTTAPSLFGNVKPFSSQPTFGAGSPFGAPASTQTPPKPLVGATPASSAGEVKSLFGGLSTGNPVTSPATSAQGPGSMFGKPSTTPAGNPPVDFFASGSQKGTEKANNASSTPGGFKLGSTGGGLFGQDKVSQLPSIW